MNCSLCWVEFVAALLLQGSVQVYSRKVEYLYSLVLHALNVISRTRFGFSPFLLALLRFVCGFWCEGFASLHLFCWI